MAIVKLTPDKMEQDAALVLKTATALDGTDGIYI